MNELVNMIESKSTPTEFGSKHNVVSKMGSISVFNIFIL